jgi:prevent-host-death family protein
MPRDIPVTQARASFADLVNRVAYKGERIGLTRHGRAVAALVPAEDLERLLRLDAQAATAAAGRALSEQGPTPAASRRAVRPFGIAARAPQRPARER